MNIEEDILIQNFLKKNLSQQENDKILHRMKVDNDFYEKVKLEEQMFLNFNNDEWNIHTNTNHSDIKEYEKLLRDETTQTLKNTLNKVNQDYQQKQVKPYVSWLQYAGIAAVLIIIAVTIFWPSRVSTDQLYADYIDLSELPSLVNRGENDKNAGLIQAQKLFEEQNYDAVLSILQKEIPKNKSTTYLYTGISQMELNKFEEAAKTFDQLINSKLIDAPKGKWYKALLFIKTNKLSQARDLLLELTNNSNNYKFEEATKLLKEL